MDHPTHVRPVTDIGGDGRATDFGRHIARAVAVDVHDDHVPGAFAREPPGQGPPDS